MEVAKIPSSSLRLRRYMIGSAVVWTVIIIASLAWNSRQLSLSILELARAEGRGAFNKDTAYRRWAAMHGGLYVPITDKTPPNEYLTGVEEREITTPSGRRLTLMNPAYMTRQVHGIACEQYGVRGHITSLKPIRPQNSPDPWEREALLAFDRGEEEVSSVSLVAGHRHIRVMRPMFMEERCLKCHAEQGYTIGDVRGGLSVSVPLEPYAAVARSHMAFLSLGHGVLWLVGLCGGLGSSGSTSADAWTKGRPCCSNAGNSRSSFAISRNSRRSARLPAAWPTRSTTPSTGL
jgi:hypothetical protein